MDIEKYIVDNNVKRFVRHIIVKNHLTRHELHRRVYLQFKLEKKDREFQDAVIDWIDNFLDGSQLHYMIDMVPS